MANTPTADLFMDRIEFELAKEQRDALSLISGKRVEAMIADIIRKLDEEESS